MSKDVNWRENKAFLQFLELEFGPGHLDAIDLAAGFDALRTKSGSDVNSLYRAFYSGKMSEGGGDRKTLAQLYEDGIGQGLQQVQSAEEFWRRHPNPTLQERVDYLEHCYAVDPISRDTRIQLSKQIDDLKAQLRKRQGKEPKK